MLTIERRPGSAMAIECFRSDKDICTKLYEGHKVYVIVIVFRECESYLDLAI